ncbi:1788_t:CDS:2 [Diversispora eburnea]|uniref:Peroxidase n=1 Tax=Diversispora eburnea TaxID=1213867 RepID=A0A9N8V0B1_9GLOM|nr:1788_t:CDS:2 [Diversispora eburnea]
MAFRFVRVFSSRRTLTTFQNSRVVPVTYKEHKNTIPVLSRAYATPIPPPPPKSNSSNKILYLIGAAALIGGGGSYYLYTNNLIKDIGISGNKVSDKLKVIDYAKIYRQIADILEDNDYDDGSYGPILLRLAWHASGTYDKNTNTGGSDGSTMRFSPESDHGANAGLKLARDKLEIIKLANPEITYADLWSLGPIIPWIPGRKDADDGTKCTADGLLPDASKSSNHLREIFNRMGFDDREIVALAGAHALGRCHPDRSGYSGPWTTSPTLFTNGYYVELLKKKWQEKKWKGPKQYVDKETGELMMLPADLALIQDKKLKPYVEEYAKDEELFFKDFSAAFHKLQELGLTRTGEETVYHFKRTSDEEEDKK